MKVVASFLLFVACGGIAGDPTGAVCPPTDPPTYVSFGQPFFEKYCLDCHSSQSTNRHGAPTDQNYDTEDQIRAHAEEIDAVAGAGPSGTNTSMPKLSASVRTRPTQEERITLGEYLACVRQ